MGEKFSAARSMRSEKAEITRIDLSEKALRK